MPPKHRSQVQVELYESDKKPVGAEMQGKIVPPRNDDAFRRIYVIQIGSNLESVLCEMPHEAAALSSPNLPLSEGRSARAEGERRERCNAGRCNHARLFFAESRKVALPSSVGPISLHCD